MNKKQLKNNYFAGLVVSKIDPKTLKIRVSYARLFSKYHKTKTMHRHFLAHCNLPSVSVGAIVMIKEISPKSKHKKFAVVEVDKVKTNQQTSKPKRQK